MAEKIYAPDSILLESIACNRYDIYKTPKPRVIESNERFPRKERNACP